MDKTRLIKKMGFDSKVIKNRELRREFIAILELMLKDIIFDNEVYNVPYYKQNDYVYVNGRPTFQELVDFSRNPNTAGFKQVIDTAKHCYIGAGQDIHEMEYELKVIYDDQNETYEILVNPLKREGFIHINFGNSFLIKYNAKTQILTTKSLVKKENLESATYTYYVGQNDNMILITDVKVFDASKVVEVENNNSSNRQYNEIYNNGYYLFEQNSFILPIEHTNMITSNIPVIGRTIKLGDHEVYVCNGTIIYDIKDNEKTLENVYSEYERTGIDRITSKQNPLIFNQFMNYEMNKRKKQISSLVQTQNLIKEKHKK